MDQEPVLPHKQMFKGDLAELLGYSHTRFLMEDIRNSKILDQYERETGISIDETKLRKSKKISPALASFIIRKL